MYIKVLDRFRRKPDKVLLTGQDIISLRHDVDMLRDAIDMVVLPNAATLREDVNAALSGTAKAIYKLEALEERMATLEKWVKDHLNKHYKGE